MMKKINMKKKSEKYSCEYGEEAEMFDFSNMSAVETKRLNEIAARIQKTYTEFVDECCRKYGDNYLFWATPLASRNIYNDSDTFISLCKILLAIEECRNRTIDIVIVDNEDQRKVLERNLDKGIQIRERSKFSFIKYLKGKIENENGFFLYCVRVIKYALYTGKRSPRLDAPVSFVITPTLSSCFDGDVYNDRYFTGITDYKDVVFVPYININSNISVRSIISKYKNCSNYRFLLPFLFFRVRDLIEIVKYKRLSERSSHDRFYYENKDITEIIARCFREGKSNNTSYKGILMWSALKRMSKDPRISADSFVLWYEGRPNDIMVASAIRKFFPNCKCVGYEGYPIEKLDMSLYVSGYQFVSRHSPGVMAIPSRLYEIQTHQYCKKMPVIYIPILRNEYIYHKSRFCNTPCKCLIILPIFREMAKTILQSIVHIGEKLLPSYIFMVKNHPVNVNYTIEEYGVECEPGFFEFVDGSLNDCLKDVDICITSESTSTLEVLFAGIKLIIICKNGSLASTFLPPGSFTELYHIVYDSKELYEAIKLCRNENCDNSALNRMLEMKTKENVCRMF